ncbi:MAG: hypothetical protein Q9166_002100 [cf. Caloplaca sp. 2 TL-2023]
MDVSISSSIIACLKAFNQFVDEIEDPDKEKPAGLVVQRWQDELGRLRIWASNIGAHQTNQSSLDYRLRDSSHIRQQIIKLLDELVQRLRDARDASSRDDDEDDDVESLEGSSSEDEDSQTEIQQLQRSVITIVNCLFQMSMLVRKPAQHDLHVGSKKADVAFFGPHDYRHVRDKYPKAEEFVVSRLGHAITRRRMYLKYRERHAMKLKQGINGITREVAHNDDATRTDLLSETVATDAQTWNIDFNDNTSESGFSQTSYAPTLTSGGDIIIPPPPRESQGGAPFECPYCYFIVTATNPRSWQRHVFNDLQPYICVEKRCTTSDKLYSTRHEWAHHVRTEHSDDKPTLGKNQDQQESHCKLCGESQESRERHDRHVARHLQELALFVLPPRDDEDSDEGELFTDSASDSSRSERDPGLVVENNDLAVSSNHIVKDTELKENVASENHRVPSVTFDDTVMMRIHSGADDGLSSGSQHSEQFVGAEADTQEHLYPRKGKTKFPNTVPIRKAIEELGYPFEEAEDNILIGKALSKENIDEIFSLRNKLRPTYIKVHRKHLAPETLDAYELPWEWEYPDSDYMLIKRWLNEDEQEQLFEHTRQPRRQKLEKTLNSEQPEEKLKSAREESPDTSVEHISEIESEHKSKRREASPDDFTTNAKTLEVTPEWDPNDRFVLGTSTHFEYTWASKAQASPADTVLIRFLGGLVNPDNAARAGEEPLNSDAESEAGETVQKVDQSDSMDKVKEML